MGNCKDCKHWAKNMPSEARKKWEGGSDFPRFYWDYPAHADGAICVRITDSPDGAAAEVISGDYAETNSILYTKPDFGCVLFEGK